MIARLLFFILILHSIDLSAIPKYDEGNLSILGIQLFQDHIDEKGYYYLPQFPRLAVENDGSFNLLCMKYVGAGGKETNGGIFHALFEFTLTDEELEELEKELRKKVSGARIMGPVPMQEAIKDGEDGVASFRLVSSILSNAGEEGSFANQVITSGKAPLLPGSRAAIAANLNQEGATLLWESFQGTTSDVSVAVEGYFEAMVKGYNAIITADLSTVYEHFSSMSNVQGKEDAFKKQEIRSVLDSLSQTQVINIEIFDRSEGLGINTEDVQKIMDLVSQQVLSMIFDRKEGWSKIPAQETPADGEIKGRYKRGALARFFFGPGRQSYIPDDQHVLKSRKDIKNFKLMLNLSKSTTIKVPVNTSGNLRGVFEAFGEDENYFRVVNLDDPDFQKREVFFQIDGDFVDAFGELVNFVTVSFKKEGDGTESDITRDIIFRRQDLEAGEDVKAVSYPRLGELQAEWLNYEFRVGWSLKGMDTTLRSPSDPKQWISEISPSISLIPPFQKKVIEIDADRTDLQNQDIRSGTIRFFTILGGKPRHLKSLIIRSADAVNTNRVALYHDPDTPLAYQVNWYSPSLGASKGDLLELKDEYLFLFPPVKESFQK